MFTFYPLIISYFVAPSVFAQGWGQIYKSEHGNQDAPAVTEPSCSTALIEASLKTDEGWGFFEWKTGLSVPESCLTPLSKNLSAKDVESAVLGSSYLGLQELGSKKDSLVADCISKYEVQKKSVGVELQVTEAKKRSITADYYYGMHRLSSAAKGNILALASIDQLLGRTGAKFLEPKEGQKIVSPLLPGTADWVEQIKDPKSGCQGDVVRAGRDSPNENFDLSANGHFKALQLWRDLNNQRSNNVVVQRASGPGAMPAITYKNPALEEQLIASQGAIMNEFPLLEDRAFQKLLVPNKEPDLKIFGSAFKQVLTLKREALLSKIENLSTASKCLNGSGSVDCIEHAMKEVSEGDDLSMEELIAGFKSEAAGNKHGISVSSELAAAECRARQRHTKNEINKLARDTGWSMATSLVPMAAASKVLQLRKIAATGKTAANTAKMNSLAGVAAVGEAGGIAQAIHDGLEACNQKYATFVEGVVSQAGKTQALCSSVDPRDIQARQDYFACKLAASLGGVAGLAGGYAGYAVFTPIKGAIENLRHLSPKAQESLIKKLTGAADQATAARTPSTATRIGNELMSKAEVDTNLRFLETLGSEPLKSSKEFAALMDDSVNQNVITKAFKQLDEYNSGKIDPKVAAKFLADFTQEGKASLNGLNIVLEEALVMMKAKPSMSKHDVLMAVLRGKGVADDEARQMANCIRH